MTSRLLAAIDRGNSRGPLSTADHDFFRKEKRLNYSASSAFEDIETYFKNKKSISNPIPSSCIDLALPVMPQSFDSETQISETHFTQDDDISTQALSTISLLLASDLAALSLRTGLPLTVLSMLKLRCRRYLRSLSQKHQCISPERCLSKPYCNPPNHQSLRIIPNSCLTGEIHGLPNLGHTCFFNAVIQALASLTPFVRYVERIADINSLNASLTSPRSLMTQQPKLLTKLVYDVLQHVNADPILPQSQVRNKIRSIFYLVGEKYVQFKNSSLNEQQDAQEMLQALLGIIIGESLLLEDEDVIDHNKDQADRENFQRDEIEENGDTFSMESSLFSLEELEFENLTERPQERVENEDVTEGVLILEEGPELGQSIGSMETEHLALTRKEEKKQEDLDDVAHLPPNGFCKKDDLDKTNEETNTDNVESQSESFQRSKFSTSIQMMVRSLSSKTPSPLSGCVGSTLQCCQCNHTSTTGDTPFLEIPIVPTNVSAVYRKNDNDSRPKPGAIASNDSNSCRLVECLAEFLSKERVHDVKCHACPIGAELKDLEEEEAVNRKAIDSISSRHKSDTGDLREQLEFIMERKSFLLEIDPDKVELQGGQEHDDISTNYELNATSIPRPWRVDANKHLFLTRLPPVLCLHVKRLFFDPARNCMAKSVQHIDFPECLDLGSMYASEVQQGKSHVNESQGPRRPYKLMSVIEHRGHAYSGHYLTYRRIVDTNSEPSRRLGHVEEWAVVSDEKVSYLSWDDVHKCQAYMLLYEAV